MAASAAVALASLALLAQQAAAHGKDVIVSEQTSEGRQDCPIIDLIGLPIGDGCIVKASASDMRFTVLTPLGTIAFLTCKVVYTAHIGSTGDIWFADFESIGKTPCGDVRDCEVEDVGVALPWKGQIQTDGRGNLHIDMNACMDTCIGWIEGPLRIELDGAGDRWRGRVDRAQVGDTGLELDGEWQLKSRRPLHFKTAPPPLF